MSSAWRNERGIALAIVLIALIVVGALVAGALFAGTQEQRMGENSRRMEQAFGVAEYGLTQQLHDWDAGVLNQSPVYPTDSTQVGPTTSANHSGTFGGYVYNLNGTDFLVNLVGSDTMTMAGRVLAGSGARQRLGLFVRLRPLSVNIQASLTTTGAVTVAGTSVVNGYDSPPLDGGGVAWADCDPTGAPLAGIRSDDGNVQVKGAAEVDGSPTVLTDPTLDINTFTQFGDVTYAQLASLPSTVQVPPGTIKSQPSLVGGLCNKSDVYNWGDGLDPTAPCGSYFPVIHIAGDATLNGVQGQGILLVDGNLDVQGGYEFYGIAIILGTLSTTGGGGSDAHFWGSVLAQGADLSTTKVGGKATLNYSSCAISKALLATALPTVLRSRAWSQLY